MDAPIKVAAVDSRGHDLIQIPIIEAYLFFGEAREFLPASYAEAGMIKEARAEAAELMKLSPRFSLEAGSFKTDRLISDLRKAGLK